MRFFHVRLMFLIVVIHSCSGVEWLRSTMGDWASGSVHNTAFYTIPIELNTPALTLDFSQSAKEELLYTTCGSLMVNGSRIPAQWVNGGILIGGTGNIRHCTLVWHFQAPYGTTFSGGSVTVSLEPKSGGLDRSLLGQTVFVGISESLVMTGGTSFWNGMTGYNMNAFSKTYYDPVGAEAQDLVVDIPNGAADFYLAVTRDVIAESTGKQIYINDILVQSQFTESSGLTIDTGRTEPIWSADEIIAPTVTATTLPGNIRYILHGAEGKGRLPTECRAAQRV